MNQKIHFQQIFKNKPFCLFLFSGFFLFLISQFYFLAQVSIVLELTKSTVLLGSILMVMAIPRLIILPIGGILIDRFSEKKVLIIGYSALILFLTTLGILEVLNQLSLVIIFIFAGLLGVSSAVILPANYSIVPKLVNEQSLQSANALVQFLNQLSLFIGPAIAGLLLGIFELGTFFFIMVGLIFISLVLIIKINDMKEIDKEVEKSNESMVKGFVDIAKQPLIIILILFTAVLNISVIGPQQVGLPVLANGYLKMDTKGLGYLLSAFGFGSLIGVVTGGLLSSKKNSLTIMLLMAIPFGIIWGVFSWLNSTWIVLALLCVMGFLIGIINVLFITILQTSSPKHLLGRVMSLQFMGSTGIQPISYFVTGLLISLMSLQITYVIAGSIIIVFSCIFLALSKHFKIGEKKF